MNSELQNLPDEGCHMSGQVDVLAAMDAAIMRNGHRGDNLLELDTQKRARAAVAALIAERDALREKLERLLEAARDVADEHMGVVAGTIYINDEDEVGERVCCGVLSYKDHAKDCPAVRLRAILAATGESA